MRHALLLLAALGPILFGSGGGSAEDAAGRHLSASLGQPIIGVTAADTTTLRAGFWSRPAESTTPVELADFHLTWMPEGVRLAWRVVGEPVDHAGFHVFRRIGDGDESRVTADLISGGPDLSWIDTDKTPGPRHYRLAEVSRQGHLAWYGPLSILLDNAAPALSLHQNRPNPFRGSTTIQFQTPRDGEVRLILFDMAGRAVAVLHDDILPAGLYELNWNGRTADGRRAAAGVYVAHLETTAGRRSLKLTLLP